jgi:hypothetical protein
MRIWSIHPRYLDSKGLVALWREALLARTVLENKTKGYRNHPQLLRFKSSINPLDAINYYLTAVYDEAAKRGYHFYKNKIKRLKNDCRIPVTNGQVRFEFDHLMAKLKIRDPERYNILFKVNEPDLNPLFFKTEGSVEKWEKIAENKF